MWNLQTRMGRRPRCHLKPLRENRSCGQCSRRSHLTTFKTCLLMGQPNSHVKEMPSIQRATPNSQGSLKNSQPVRKKSVREEENKGERSFSATLDQSAATSWFPMCDSSSTLCGHHSRPDCQTGHSSCLQIGLTGSTKPYPSTTSLGDQTAQHLQLSGAEH